MNSYLDKIKDCVIFYLGGEEISIALFGSMAGGTVHGSSDVDIAIIPRGKWNRSKLTLLKERIEELNVPYKVDLVDFSSVSETFRKEVLRTAILWKITEKVE